MGRNQWGEIRSVASLYQYQEGVVYHAAVAQVIENVSPVGTRIENE